MGMVHNPNALCQPYFADGKTEAQGMNMGSPSGLAWGHGQSPDHAFLLLHAVSQELLPRLLLMGLNHSLALPSSYLNKCSVWGKAWRGLNLPAPSPLPEAI